MERLRERVDGQPLYVSMDTDVLDPAFAPGTGTPKIGGFTTRELAGVLRRFAGSNLVGAGIVEVAPAYDHAEVTTIAAANLAYELIALDGGRKYRVDQRPRAEDGSRHAE